MSEPKNYGVLLGQRPEDYIAGVDSPIIYEERNPSGDWTAFLPSEERQFSKYADSMACVSYSALNAIETQLKFLTGVETNYSDRALAKMSGTTAEGNYLWNVADTIRKNGLIEEQYWPTPKDFTWETFYAPIPLEVQKSAGEFLKLYEVKYEWLPDTNRETLRKHLKQSPIQVVIPGHAILCFYSNADIDRYFDQYAPFVKEHTGNFLQALKYVVKPKTKAMTQEEVVKQYVLAFYREPDSEELAYWTGKPLIDFLNTAIKDRAVFLDLHK